MRKRVLIVDDEPHVATLVARNLTQSGYETATAPDGREALKLLDSWGPDLIVLDIMMPEIDGMEVIEILRGDPRTVELPVVILTAKSEDADIARGWAAGAHCYITKPFSPEELVTVVNRILDTVSSGGAT